MVRNIEQSPLSSPLPSADEVTSNPRFAPDSDSPKVPRKDKISSGLTRGISYLAGPLSDRYNNLHGPAKAAVSVVLVLGFVAFIPITAPALGIYKVKKNKASNSTLKTLKELLNQKNPLLDFQKDKIKNLQKNKLSKKEINLINIEIKKYAKDLNISENDEILKKIEASIEGYRFANDRTFKKEINSYKDFENLVEAVHTYIDDNEHNLTPEEIITLNMKLLQEARSLRQNEDKEIKKIISNLHADIEKMNYMLIREEYKTEIQEHLRVIGPLIDEMSLEKFEEQNSPKNSQQCAVGGLWEQPPGENSILSFNCIDVPWCFPSMGMIGVLDDQGHRKSEKHLKSANKVTFEEHVKIYHYGSQLIHTGVHGALIPLKDNSKCLFSFKIANDSAFLIQEQNKPLKIISGRLHGVPHPSDNFNGAILVDQGTKIMAVTDGLLEFLSQSELEEISKKATNSTNFLSLAKEKIKEKSNTHQNKIKAHLNSLSDKDLLERTKLIKNLSSYKLEDLKRIYQDPGNIHFLYDLCVEYGFDESQIIKLFSQDITEEQKEHYLNELSNKMNERKEFLSNAKLSALREKLREDDSFFMSFVVHSGLWSETPGDPPSFFGEQNKHEDKSLVVWDRALYDDIGVASLTVDTEATRLKMAEFQIMEFPTIWDRMRFTTTDSYGEIANEYLKRKGYDFKAEESLSNEWNGKPLELTNPNYNKFHNNLKILNLLITGKDKEWNKRVEAKAAEDNKKMFEFRDQAKTALGAVMGLNDLRATEEYEKDMDKLSEDVKDEAKRLLQMIKDTDEIEEICKGNQISSKKEVVPADKLIWAVLVRKKIDTMNYLGLG